MSPRPTLAWILSLVGGLVLIFLSSEISVGSLFFLVTLVSGLIFLAGAVMLFLKPRSHSLWGIVVVVVAIVDLLGALYFIYSPFPEAQAFTFIGTLGPICALVGGIAGLIWKPT